ncbi:hypothetical protein BS50DRAFT_639534 [Corynespora cassiicola Philippines]|uniref:Uncharacterized protein n=1 Tax=Corynespora cassiicola Philippines TaxID=1448308 RepID=A0A2T2N7T0_CORCC|nr:hypothetical protein BS50DRAFT_639534 [Corynespora cassiicola Philippines]
MASSENYSQNNNNTQSHDNHCSTDFFLGNVPEEQPPPTAFSLPALRIPSRSSSWESVRPDSPPAPANGPLRVNNQLDHSQSTPEEEDSQPTSPATPSSQSGEDLDMGMTTLLQHGVSTRRARKKGRYYSYALARDDHISLMVGERNHNHKQWTLKDMVEFQKSRVDIVPVGLKDRDEILEQIMYDAARCQQLLLHSERQVSPFNVLRQLTSPTTPKEDGKTDVTQAARLRQSQRTKSAPSLSMMTNPPMDHSRRMASYGNWDHSRRLSSHALSDHPYRSSFHGIPPRTSSYGPPSRTSSHRPPPAHLRHTSSSDVFRTRRQGRHLSVHASQLSRGFTPTHSRLASEVRTFEPNPSVTFDSFLSPHSSGKGEAYRGANNAKNETSGETSGESAENEAFPIKLSRRLSRMASIKKIRASVSPSKEAIPPVPTVPLPTAPLPTATPPRITPANGFTSYPNSSATSYAGSSANSAADSSANSSTANSSANSSATSCADTPTNTPANSSELVVVKPRLVRRLTKQAPLSNMRGAANAAEDSPQNSSSENVGKSEGRSSSTWARRMNRMQSLANIRGNSISMRRDTPHNSSTESIEPSEDRPRSSRAKHVNKMPSSGNVKPNEVRQSPKRSPQPSPQSSPQPSPPQFLPMNCQGLTRQATQPPPQPPKRQKSKLQKRVSKMKSMPSMKLSKSKSKGAPSGNRPPGGGN